MTITDDTLIRDLPLSNRVKHALYQGRSPTRPGFSYDRTFGEVRTLSDGELLRTSGFGLTSLREWVRVRDEALGGGEERGRHVAVNKARGAAARNGGDHRAPRDPPQSVRCGVRHDHC